MRVFKGKFSTDADEAAYEMTLDGPDEELGEAQTFGWYGLLVFSDEDRDLLVEVGGDEYADAEAAIVHEDEQGFVDVDYFTSAAEARDRWSEIEDEFEAFNGESEDYMSVAMRSKRRTRRVRR